MKNKIIPILVVSVVIYTVLFGISQAEGVSWSALSLNTALLIVLLVSFAYVLRFLRWDYYLKKTGIKTDRKTSFLVFLSGFTMSITPNKVGELLKCQLLKEKENSSLSKSVPVVFVERLSDALSLVILAAAGILLSSAQIEMLLPIIVILVLAFALLYNKKLLAWMASKAVRMPFIRKLEMDEKEILKSMKTLLSPEAMLASTFLGVGAWMLECLSFYFLLSSFGVAIPITASFVIFAASSLIGALSMIPGGLGTTEGSMLFMLAQYSSVQVSSAVILLIRIFTLWYAVLLGLVAYFIYQKKL